MLKINRTASAAWSGGLRDARADLDRERCGSPPILTARRPFRGKKGTNPEEAVGPAHAGCFTMALSLILGEAKLTAEQMDTTERSRWKQVEGAFENLGGASHTQGQDPRRRPEDLRELAGKAKAMPVSKVLKANITLRC